MTTPNYYQQRTSFGFKLRCTLRHQKLHAAVLDAFSHDQTGDRRFRDALNALEVVQARQLALAKGHLRDSLPWKTDSPHLYSLLSEWKQDPNLPEVVRRVRDVVSAYLG